jgi:hypothetical protein
LVINSTILTINSYSLISIQTLRQNELQNYLQQGCEVPFLIFVPLLNNPALNETGTSRFSDFISRETGTSSYTGTCTLHINIPHIIRNSYFEDNIYLLEEAENKKRSHTDQGFSFLELLTWQLSKRQVLEVIRRTARMTPASE